MRTCDPVLLKHLEFLEVLKAIEQHYPSPVARYFGERLEPSFDYDEVQRRQSRGRAWEVLFTRYLTPGFTRGVADIVPVLDKLQSSSLNSEDFVLLLVFFRHYEAFRKTVEEIRKEGLLPEVLYELFALPAFVTEMSELDRVFDENGSIRETASPKIQSIVQEQRRLERRFGSFVEEFVKNNEEFLQEPIVTRRRGRTVVLVRTDRFQADRFLVYEPSGSRASVYAEPVEFIEFNNRRQQLASDLEEEIQRLLAQLSRAIGARREEITGAFRILVEAAFYGAVSQWSREVHATYPELNRENVYHLIRARHPLFANDCIPNDLMVGEAWTILILSGPNAGGKTVLLKTLGLLVLLTLCGLPIPADPGSTLPVPSAMVGAFAEDPGILSTLSTFTSHLVPLKFGLDFISSCSPEEGRGTLFLLDELGTGTDPDEGAAFAEAVLRWLREKGPRVVISTHFPRLKILKYELGGIENAGLGYDLEKMAPTYRLHYGVPGPSYGISVARKFGIKEEIVHNAEKNLESPSLPIEQALFRAQEELEEARRIREESEARARETTAHSARLAEKERSLDRDLRERYLQRIRQAESLIRAWTARAEELFKRLESEIKTARAVRESRQALWDLYRSVREWKEREESPSDSPYAASPEPFRKELFYPLLGRMVMVLTPEDPEGYVWVQAGQTRLKVPSSSLRQEPPPVATGSHMPLHPRPLSVDLRGKDKDSALLMLDHSLNHAFSSGVEYVEVVHGKGTGKLRDAIHEFLRSHCLVADFFLVAGNPGVTRIVLITRE